MIPRWLSILGDWLVVLCLVLGLTFLALGVLGGTIQWLVTSP